MAGLIYAWKADYNLKDTAKKALIAAQITLVNSATINPSMSSDYLESKYNEQYA